VPYFADEQDVYAHLGRLFTDLLADEQLTGRFREADTVVQYRYRNPEAQVTARLLAGEEAAVDLGPTELAPELVLTMDADVAHRFWLGKLSVRMALLRGQIKAQGPAAKLLKLAPLADGLRERYRAQLQAAGRADLLDI
jgi:hypothetical protein